MHEIYIFVGENRSELAQKNGYSWDECQRTGKPVLAMKPLWEALEEINLDPKAQIFFNLWDDSLNFDSEVPKILKGLADNGKIIIGMGKKVQKELQKLGIPHLEMVHPAARGKIRKTVLYRKHVREVLTACGGGVQYK